MAENQPTPNVPGGNTPAAPGGSSESDGSGGGAAPTPGDKVSYHTYEKLLGEKKRLADENANLKAQQEARDAEARATQAADLEAKQNWKALAELRDAENKKLQAKLDANTQVFVDAQKIEAFTRALGGHIAPQYIDLVNTNEILIDPSTGAVDEGSVAKCVQNFKARYPEIIATRKGALPANAPAGSGGALTYDAWLKLPPKEMVARRKEVVE